MLVQPFAFLLLYKICVLIFIIFIPEKLFSYQKKCTCEESKLSFCLQILDVCSSLFLTIMRCLCLGST